MSRQENKSGAAGSSSESAKIKETLDFLLHAYRAKLAVDNPSESCPFDFTEFLENWKDKYDNWEGLKAAMIKDLEPLANEGLFDSILPYLTASLNQSKSSKEHKKSCSGSGAFSTTVKDVEGTTLISAELTPLSTATNNEPGSSSNACLSSNGSRQRPTSNQAQSLGKKHVQNDIEVEFDPEIIIHVCDEAKCLKKDFYCLQSILVKEMGYFTKVTVKGQRLRDMDISVHCDISVFEWLMKWVKSQNGGYEQHPVLGDQ